jgi:hypothetical protein
MNIELEALRKAIDEAGRGLAEYEKARSKTNGSADPALSVMRAQLGALKATHSALVEIDARLLGFPEPTT